MVRTETATLYSRRHALGALTVVAFCSAGLASGPSTVRAEAKEPSTISLEISGRKVMVADKTLRFKEGTELRIEWSTDEKVELHLHGYNVKANAEPGRTVSMSFLAHTAGRFPVTAHDFGHATLIYLEIHPK